MPAKPKKPKLLSDTCARDLMSRKVISLPAGALLREAVAIFEDEHITGVPVVDLGGKVVGMLSEHDLARASRQGRSGERTDYDMAEPRDETWGDPWDEATSGDSSFGKEDYSAELLGQETVGDWMRPGVVAVAPDTPLRLLCQQMVAESIHRVIVMDSNRPVGIVTTSDVVRLLAETL